MTYHYEDGIAELQRDYPVGSVVEVESQDGERYRARVTGYGEVVNDGPVVYKNPGPQLCVSTNPPDHPKVEDTGIDVARAAMVPPERIIELVDEGDGAEP